MGLGTNFEPLYGDPDGPCLEGWSLLAALGAATRTIRLGTLVTGMTYRHPAVLAAQAVTIDHISGGRLVGLGAACTRTSTRTGSRPPFSPRPVSRLRRGHPVTRTLMTEDAASFEGKHHQLDDASYRPHRSEPHPPI